MKPKIKIRFTEPQIALLMRAHPHCNLDRLTELCFEFDQAGKIIDCIGTIKDGGSIDHDYSGSGLARLSAAAAFSAAAFSFGSIRDHIRTLTARIKLHLSANLHCLPPNSV
jgi:hypothetical protein